MTATSDLLTPPAVSIRHPRLNEIVDGWMAALDERGAELAAVAEAEDAETAERVADYEALVG